MKCLLWAAVVRHSVAGVEGQYSAFSGLTVPLSIGVPEQMIRVALDFTNSNTLLFIHTACPPFTPCFIESASRRFQLDLEVSGSATDLMSFDTVYRRVAFQTLSTRTHVVAKNSEVAGVVSVSPSSALFANEVLSMHSNHWLSPHAVMLLTGKLVFLEATTGMRIRSVSEHEWRVRGTVWAHELDIVIDVSEQDVILPFTMRDQVQFRGLSAVREGRLFVECAWRRQLRIEVQFGVAGPIRLSSHSLLLSGTSGELCGTRIRFGFASHAILGRPLLESLNRIVFDFKTAEAVLVRSVEDYESRGFPWIPAPPPLVPVFKGPAVIVPTTGGCVVEFQATRNTEGLVLYDWPAFEPGNAWMWRFARTHPSDLDIGEVHVPGVFYGSTFAFVSGRLRIDLREVDPSLWLAATLSLRTTRDSVTVVLLPISPPPIVAVADLDLPPVHSTVGGECAICLSAFAAGEEVQPLPGCNHEFHRECVTAWLARNRLTCPTCRSVVAGRADPGSDVARPASPVNIPNQQADCCTVS